MTDHIMAFDIGTSSLKAALIDKRGKIVAEGNTSYPVKQIKQGWAEQDPEEIWQSICQTSQEVIRCSAMNPAKVKGIVFVAPWKNIIALDTQGNVLRDSIIWMDSRASVQAKRLNSAMKKFIGTGQEYWPRLMWMKEHEPLLWQQAQHIIGLNSFLKFRATGELVTEPSDDLIRSSNPELNEYYYTILKAADLLEDLHKFPVAKESTEQAGHLTTVASEQLGLMEGTPVFGGFGDLVAITRGAGCSQLHDTHIYFGTSSWLVCIIKNRSDLQAPLYFSVNSTTEGATFALQTSGLALDWLISQLYNIERMVLDTDIYNLIEKEVRQIAAGSDGIIATHWLTGELTPFSKNAKGLFINLTTSHDRRHMVRAMMESICFTHRNNLHRLRTLTDITLDHIRVVGGGAVSDVWMQMLADILQLRVEVPKAPRYAGTLGAWYCAALSLGWVKNLHDVKNNIRIEKIFVPNPDNRDIYDHNYQIYMKLHPALRQIHNELNGDY